MTTRGTSYLTFSRENEKGSRVCVCACACRGNGHLPKFRTFPSFSSALLPFTLGAHACISPLRHQAPLTPLPSFFTSFFTSLLPPVARHATIRSSREAKSLRGHIKTSEPRSRELWLKQNKLCVRDFGTVGILVKIIDIILYRTAIN